jgi:DNA-binding CsgD family transcriptional regulator
MEVRAQEPMKVDRWEICARAGLTPRQIVIADALVEGLSYAEIAERLSISYHTVHSHVKSIHRKLDVHSNARLVALLHAADRDG